MDLETFPVHLAENVRGLRECQGLTQSQLAKRAQVPRATLGLLESGSANPTLAVVIRVSNALGVRLEALLEAPHDDTVVYRASEIPEQVRGRSKIRRLLPRSLEGVELEELTIPAGATLVGVPHKVGTREYLVMLAGNLTLSAAGAAHPLSVGDVAIFRGHQKHSYRNPGRAAARAVSVIAHPRLAMGASVKPHR